MGIVIDTGVFIRWEREGGRLDLGRWGVYGDPAISVITQSELMVGVHRADTAKRRDQRLQFVNSILSNVRILPIYSRTADVHAQLVFSLYQSGIPIGPHDNWIAAAAIANSCVLLTTNAGEFSRVPGLNVVDYLSKS